MVLEPGLNWLRLIMCIGFYFGQFCSVSSHGSDPGLNNIHPNSENKHPVFTSDDMLEVPAEEGEVSFPTPAVPGEKAEPEEEPTRVTEFYSAYINVSYIQKNQQLLHTERKEVGRFSSGGAQYAAGVATKLQSKNVNESIADYGCTQPLAYNTSLEGVPIIAIIKRGLCTFDVKVANAKTIGAAGVLIYDNIDENRLKTIQVSSDSLPTVFTYKWKGIEIINQLDLGVRLYIALEEGSHCKIQGKGKDLLCTKGKDWNPVENVYNHADPFDKKNNRTPVEVKTSVMFVSFSFLILIMISMVWLLLYYVQRFRFIHSKEEMERRMGQQAKEALNCVALHVVAEDERERECSVCLDTLNVGDEVRSLPCAHMFHRACVDNWLLSKRKCPLCNLNIVRHFGLLGLDDSQDSQDSHDSESQGVVYTSV